MHLRFYAPRAACSLQLTMKRLIAIVEDEPAIRDNYAAAFTREGYAVRTYSNRAQAISAFAARLPDLAIIDISLEEEPEGGFELCRRLRALWDARVVLLSLTEFWIVHALARHPGHVRNRQQLMDAANVVLDDNTITSHVKRIRRKFQSIDPKFDAVQTVYGMGYRWVE